MCGNQRVDDRVRTRHCLSQLDRSNNTLTLRVNCSVQAIGTYVDRPPGVSGTVTYACRPLETSTVDNFKLGFAAAIQQHWHNKLWISPALPDPNIAPIRCGVEVSFVNPNQNPHCRIIMLFEPTPATGQRNIGFRSFCARGGHANVQQRDMVIAYKLFGTGRADDFDWTGGARTSTGDVEAFTQNLAAHEFGHYLGLNHRCFSPATANASADYCISTTRELMENIMAVGNTVTPAHAEPWASRLRRHHYHCDRTWIGSTTPVQHDSSLINSLAGTAP